MSFILRAQQAVKNLFWLLIALLGTTVRSVDAGTPDSKQRVTNIDGRGYPSTNGVGSCQEGTLE